MTIVEALRYDATAFDAPKFPETYLPDHAELLRRAADLIEQQTDALRGLVDLTRRGMGERCFYCDSYGKGTVMDPKKHAETCPIGRALAAILEATGMEAGR